MIWRHASLLLFAAAAAAAQSSITPPVIGAIRDSQGTVQTVMGVAGNFILAGTGITNVVSAAFSGRGGLAKTDTELLVLNESGDVAARFEAPGGPALFGFDANGNPALAYYGGSLLRLHDSGIEPVHWTGDALSIASVSPDSAAVLIRRGRQLWRAIIAMPDGAVRSESLVPQVSLPAMLLADGGVVFVRADEIVLRDQAGAERTARIDFRPASLSLMGRGWILIRAADGRSFGLQITSDELRIYQLPEVTL